MSLANLNEPQVAVVTIQGIEQLEEETNLEINIALI